MSSAASPPSTGPRYGEGRAALIAATVRVVGTRGLRGFTLRTVADEAGVDSSLVVRHFGGRDGLLEAALDWACERSIETSSLSRLADADAYLAGLLDSLERDDALYAFQLELVLEARRRPELRPRVRALYERYRRATARSLHPVRPEPTSLDRAVFASLDGLVLQHLAGTIDRDELAAGVRALLAAATDATASMEATDMTGTSDAG